VQVIEQVTVVRFDVLTVTEDSSFRSVILCHTLLDCLTHEGEGITVF
jgi:hypothetical protein